MNTREDGDCTALLVGDIVGSVQRECTESDASPTPPPTLPACADLFLRPLDGFAVPLSRESSQGLSESGVLFINLVPVAPESSRDSQYDAYL